MLELLSAHFLSIAIFLICVLVAGFLNLIIYNIPVKQIHSWHKQAKEFLASSTTDPDPNVKGAFSLRTSCNICKQPFSSWVNSPLIGDFIKLKHASKCNQSLFLQFQPISISLITLIITFLTFTQFHMDWRLIPALIFTWSLIVISFIDFQYNWILDDIAIPVLWLGLLVNSFNTFTSLKFALFGAVAGYLIYYLPNKIYKWLAKKDGMGMGDFKLAAAIGAWIGIKFLLPALILSLILNVLVFIKRKIFWKSAGLDKPLPFGPYLALAGWIFLLYQFDIFNMI